MRTVLYGRVSTEEQKNNQTITTQVHGSDGMLEYAKKRGIPPPEESTTFLDDGFSGASLIRPGLTALREYIKTHDDIGYFLAYDPDRLARDTHHQLIILDELKRKNIKVHFKTGELGSGPNDKLLFVILSAFSEFERAKILERTQRGMKKRIESGKFNGGRPLYGFKYNHTLGKHELDEEEMRMVKMIFDWHTEDKLNIRQIQQKLFDMKIPSKYDRLKNTEKNKKLKGLKKHPFGWWSEATIRNILTNEAYTGRWYCGKNYTVKLEIPNPRTGKPKVRQLKRPKEEWFLIEVPRIVSNEQFKKAQLQARKNLMFAKRCTKQTYLLQGLIKCGKDGLKYRGHQEKSGVIYYYCKSRMKNTPQKNCNSPYLRADQVEPIVWNTVKSLLENPEEIFNAFRNESILNEERAKTTQGRLDYIDEAIKKLETAKKRITEAFKAEAMTLQEFRKEKTDIELSEEKLISERDGLTNKLNIQHNIEAKIDLFKETCHKFLSKINDPKIVTERLKKDIIKLVIDEVVIEGEKLKIAATIPLPSKIHEREIAKTDLPDTFNAGATLGPINQTKMERIWTKHKQLNTTLKPKVFVAMSGGVDSSVAVALLKRAGFDVVGVHLKLWREKKNIYNNRCCSLEAEKRARTVARILSIPFYVFNFEKEFKKKIVDYFLKEHKAGRTPNPCVFCNKKIKLGLLLEKALRLNADFVATGHYARLRREILNPKSEIRNYRYKLLKGRDKEKDQSYFLWQLNQKQLKHIFFPVGDCTKTEVRKMAKKFKLPFAKIPESMEVCFIKKTINDFLKKYLKEKPGDIIDTGKKKIGRHKGLWFYTIGQRKGMKLPQGPYYVLEKNLKKNILIVTKNEKDLYKKELVAKNINWIGGEAPKLPQKVMAKIRYRQKAVPAIIKELKKGGIKIIFLKPQKAVTPGQSVVFYSGKSQELLGGGIIEV